MLARFYYLWALLVTWPVLLLAQKYYMNFIFNNNNYAKVKSPSNSSSANFTKDLDLDSHDHTDEEFGKPKFTMRSPSVTHKKRKESGSKEASSSSARSIERRDHAHSVSHEHSDSYEVVHHKELPMSKHALGMSPSLEADVNDFQSNENTDEEDYHAVDMSMPQQDTMKRSSHDGSKDDLAIMITNQTQIDTKKAKKPSEGHDNDIVVLKASKTESGSGDSQYGVDNINFENVFQPSFRINNAVCRSDKMLNEAFGLDLNDDHELKIKILCKIPGYRDRWLLVMRKSFPTYRYFPDFSSGFAPKDLRDMAINMDTLSYITNNRQMQLIMIGRDNKQQPVYAKYDHFVVGDVQEEYALKSLGNFEGNTTDWFSHFLNNHFTDYLKIYVEKFDCEIMKLGGWWATNTTHCTFPEDRDPEYIGSLEMYIQATPENQTKTEPATAKIKIS